MKLRSRDFGDGETLLSAKKRFASSMKLRSRDFGDAVDLIAARTVPRSPQ